MTANVPSTEIHPTAVVSDEATIGEGVRIGAYAVVGPGVTVGDRCSIEHHADVRGPLVIGADTVIGHSAAIGHDPQVKGSDGPFGSTRIGARNVFREFAQVHRSRVPDGVTVIGDDGYFMTSAHVAHDCVLGNHVTMCTGAMLAGHVTVEDRAFFGGLAAIHQFARVGTLAILGGHSGPGQDVPPFVRVVGVRPCVVRGLNAVGIRRAGLSTEARQGLKRAFQTIFRGSGPLPERLDAVDVSIAEVAHLVSFIRTTERGVIGIARTEAGE